VERTVLNPNDSDIRSIKREALDRVLKSGANEATVEISIEIDKQANILRAIATGATELRTKDLSQKSMDQEGLIKIAATSMNVEPSAVALLAHVGKWHVFEGIKFEKRWVVFRKKSSFIRVLDRDGVIRLQKNQGEVVITQKSRLMADLAELIDKNTEFSDAGGRLPLVYLYYGEKQLDLSGLVEKSQINSMVDMEMAQMAAEEDVIILATQ
jgi:N-methylhydantoinase A